MKIAFQVIFAILFINISCTSEKTNTTEIFNNENRPFYSYDSEKNQYTLMPWNHELEINKNRNYPLVIFLHGAGGAGNISYLNYLGYDNHNDSAVDSIALNFQKEHPCYVLIPQTDSYWNNNSLIEQVENFKKDHRVDTNRIYLVGYSMGGSGSYSFANSYFDYNGHLFASIMRLAGQSQTEVRGKIAEQTAIWIHIGLNDSEKRVQVTRDAYIFFKNLYPEANETTSVVQIEGYDGVTYSLYINGVDRFKRTEYKNVGHGVVAFPFKDPYLIKWLFNHKIN